MVIRINPNLAIRNYPQNNNKVAFKAKSPIGMDIFTQAAIKKDKTSANTLKVIISILMNFFKGGRPPVKGIKAPM